MKYISALICIFLLGFPSVLQARPISYPGGWMVMQMNDSFSNSLHINYTPTPKYSIGYKGEYWRDGDWQFHGAELDYLVKRWNNPQSQANLYLQSAAGIAYSDAGSFNDKTEPAAFTGVSIDWEDRRFFTMYENMIMYAGDIDKFYSQKARVGIAPYIGDYGDLHTWLMLQVNHDPKHDDEFVFTPMVRLFKSEYLAEAGVSDNGDILLNFSIIF